MNFSWGSEMISPNSFCGFIFARAIDMNLEPLFLYNRSGKNDSWKQFDLFLGNCNTRFWNDISQLILWIYLHKGHRYDLRPPVSLQPVEQEWSKKNIIPLKLCSFAEGSEIISANSFCGFTFARAIDMNLDPPFLCNRSGKNDENNLIYFLETVTQGSEMISPNSFCGFIFANTIDMNLDPLFLYSRLNKNDWNLLLL